MKINFRKFFCQFVKGFLYKLFDCQRYEKEPEKLEIPEPKYIEVKICLDSGLLAGNYCPVSKIEWKRFIAGTEPKEICDIHKKVEPKPKKYPKVVPFCQVDIMGGFIGDFQWTYYQSPKEAKEKWNQTLERYRKLGVGRIKFFVWCADPHPTNKYIKDICPYLKIDEDSWIYDLSRWDERWFESYIAFLKLLKEKDLKPLVCAFMARYGDTPFKVGHNVNSVSGIYDKEARKYQIKLINRLLRIERNIFGEDHEIHFEIMNEPHHDGTDRTVHAVADFHRDIYLQSNLKDEVKLINLYLDCHNEASLAHFTGSVCPKCGYQFDFIGKPKRQVQVIEHGYSIPENLDERFDAFLLSGWNPPSCLWLGGDGGSGDKMGLAKGYALYNSGGKIIWRQGDANQIYQLCYEALKKAIEKKKEIGFQLAHFETLQKDREWPLREDFSEERILWARVKAMTKAVNDVLGSYKMDI